MPAPPGTRIEETLPSIRIGRRTTHGPVIAYADDVTIFVTTPKDFNVIQKAISTYEQATGACLNPRKSKALAVGAWTESPTLLGIGLHERVNILGVEVGETVALSIRDIWTRVICAV